MSNGGTTIFKIKNVPQGSLRDVFYCFCNLIIMYDILSGRMSGATHVTIHHYSNYDTEYKKLKTAI